MHMFCSKFDLLVCFSQAVKDYTADKALFAEVVPLEDAPEGNILVEGRKFVKRAYLTEFEYKAGRHANKSKSKKKMIGDRIAEYSAATKGDWAVDAWKPLADILQAIMDGPGP
jgi:hypothetical protein